MSNGGGEEKNLPASGRKLREARRKGQIARSKEMVTAAVSVAALAYLTLRSNSLASAFGESLAAAGDAAGEPWRRALPHLLPHLLTAAGMFLLPLLTLLTAVAVVTAVVSSGGIVFALDPIALKIERINPAEGLKRLFSLRSGTEALKTIVKFVLIALTAIFLLRSSLQALVELPACGLNCTPSLTAAILRPLILFACLFFLVIGGLDLWLQRGLHLRDMRMTRSEQKRDRQESHGNPLIRRRLRQEQQALAQQRMRLGVRNATFIVRSDHVALAFRYQKPDTSVPVLVAKAAHEALLTLLAEADRIALPQIYDREAAAALSEQIRVGKLVPKDLFPVIIRCMREAGLL